MSDVESENLNVFEFPCLIEVKIFFLNSIDQEQAVKQLVSDCIELPYFEGWSCKQSKAGKYRSASAAIRAQNREQMDKLYQTLSDSDKVIMVI